MRRFISRVLVVFLIATVVLTAAGWFGSDEKEEKKKKKQKRKQAKDKKEKEAAELKELEEQAKKTGGYDSSYGYRGGNYESEEDRRRREDGERRREKLSEMKRKKTAKTRDEMVSKDFNERMAEEDVDETFTPEDDEYMTDEDINHIWAEHMHDFVPEDMTNVLVEDQSTEALFEEISHVEPTLIRGAYYVLGGNVEKTVNCMVYDPNRELVYKRMGSAQGILLFNTTMPGEYAVIFSNTKSGTDLTVTLALHTYEEKDEEIKYDITKDGQRIEIDQRSKGDLKEDALGGSDNFAANDDDIKEVKRQLREI